MIYRTSVGHLGLLSVDIYYSFPIFQALARHHLGATAQPSVYARIKMYLLVLRVEFRQVLYHQATVLTPIIISLPNNLKLQYLGIKAKYLRSSPCVSLTRGRMWLALGTPLLLAADIPA